MLHITSPQGNALHPFVGQTWRLVVPCVEQGCRGTRSPVYCRWECKMMPPLPKAGWFYLTKLNTCSPCDPAVRLLGLTQDENMCPRKDPDADVRSPFIPNLQQTAGLLPSSIKGQKMSTYRSTGASQKRYAA